MRSQRARALLTVHGAVLLFGLAGVFGKMTSLPSTDIVLGRVVFGGLALAVLLAARRTSPRPRRARDIPMLAASGVILALHWTAFFQSVLVSSVAVALLSFSTFPLFATALEPLMLRDRPRRVDVAAALLILPGIYLLVPSLDLSNSTTRGVVWGLLAGLTFAVLSIWNRGLTRRYSSPVISLYQDGVAALVLLPTLLFVRPAGGVSLHDVVVLLVLGVACTALAHTLFIEGMRTLTAQAASVIAALEPVWGVLFALVLLGEVPTLRVLFGGALILGATLLPALWKGSTGPPHASTSQPQSLPARPPDALSSR
jgi:drug/metabolite transporter (DMT)-like permease